MPPLTVLPNTNAVFASGIPNSPTTATDPNKPQFNDILNRLNKPADITQNSAFQQGITASTPSTGISPQTQQILDIIKKQQMQSQNEGIAAAQSLAAKRGITGSSTEQFGTQQAIEQAQKTGQDATTAALTNDLNQNMDLKKLQIQGLFQGAGLQLNADTDLQKLAATLTSDQIASLNNMDFQNRSLALQQLLGQQGIQVAQDNINAQKDIAQRNSEYGLAGSVLGAVTPFALGKLLPSAATTTAGGFTPYAAGGLPGPFASGAAPGAFVPGVGSIAAAGAGAYALDQLAKKPLDKAFGASGGAASRALLNPVGSTISLGKNLVTNPTQTINNALGGNGKHQQMMGDASWTQGLSTQDIALQLGQDTAHTINYDSNDKGSYERNYNKLLTQLPPDDLVTRYSQANPNQFGTALDKAQKTAYDRAVSLNGGQPITGSQFTAFLKDNSHLIKASSIVNQVFS